MGEQDRAGVHGKVWPGPARPPQPLTFIDRPWARPGLPNPSLLSTGPGPARPPKAFTFIDRASPAPNPSLLLARPLASISQSWPPAGFRPKPFRGLLLRKESLSEQNRHRHVVVHWLVAACRSQDQLPLAQGCETISRQVPSVTNYSRPL